MTGAPGSSLPTRPRGLARLRDRVEKVIAARGSPIPFLRKGSRDELRAATGTEKLPVLKLPDGTAITHSRDILNWVNDQPVARGEASGQPRETAA